MESQIRNWRFISDRTKYQAAAWSLLRELIRKTDNKIHIELISLIDRVQSAKNV
jgi:hypothetical protein